MSLEIFIVRHAQSQGNVDGLFIGHTDVPLSALGEKQAEVLCQYLSNFEIDEIYSSDLIRAVQTITPIARKLNLEIKTDKGLREINGGDWEKVRFDKIGSLFPEDYKQYGLDPVNSRPTNGESILEVAFRVKGAVDKIVQGTKGKRIVICSHATSIRGLDCLLGDGSMENWDNIPYASNASVTIYEYDDGKYKLKKRNIDDFMGDLITKLPSEVK